MKLVVVIEGTYNSRFNKAGHYRPGDALDTLPAYGELLIAAGYARPAEEPDEVEARADEGPEVAEFVEPPGLRPRRKSARSEPRQSGARASSREQAGESGA